MYQEFFAKSDHLIWPLLGLIIFVSIFLGVLAYVFLGFKDKSKIESVANLPLEDNEVITSPTEGSLS